MAEDNITEFPPVLKSTELSNWLEEHVAAPSDLARESRLLWLGRIPHPDQDPEGVIDFHPFRGAGGVPVKRHMQHPVVLRLKYQLVPIPMPAWFTPALKHDIPGHWFQMRLFKEGEILVGEFPIRQFSLARRPEKHCPTCHRQEVSEWGWRSGDCCGCPHIDEQTGEVTCYDCAGRDAIQGRASLCSGTVPSRKMGHIGRCRRCGFYPSAPIHKLELMKGNPVAHDYVPSVGRGNEPRAIGGWDARVQGYVIEH